MKFTGIQKITLVDYDKEISTTLFTGGCNFRCPFCHNFEFVLMNDDVEIFDTEEIFKYLDSRKHLLTAVVITGGEPTLYKDLKDVIKRIKAMGYKVKLDTNGTNPLIVEELFKESLIDYCAVDIKNSKELYPMTIGIDNYDISNIIKTVEFLLHNGYDYEFRTTIIKNYHTKESIREIGKWVQGAKRFFLQKFEMSENVPLKSLETEELKNVLEYKHILEEYIEDVSIRGYD